MSANFLNMCHNQAERNIWNLLGYYMILQLGNFTELTTKWELCYIILWELPVGLHWYVYVYLPLPSLGAVKPGLAARKPVREPLSPSVSTCESSSCSSYGNMLITSRSGTSREEQIGEERDPDCEPDFPCHRSETTRVNDGEHGGEETGTPCLCMSLAEVLYDLHLLTTHTQSHTVFSALSSLQHWHPCG